MFTGFVHLARAILPSVLVGAFSFGLFTRNPRLRSNAAIDSPQSPQPPPPLDPKQLSRLTLAAAKAGDLEQVKKGVLNLSAHYLDQNVVVAAAEEGNLHVLEWLWEVTPQHIPRHWWEEPGDDLEFSFSMIASAASKGQLKILQWALSKGLDTHWVCECAAVNGHLDVLRWARENKCVMNETTCAGAARGGHLDVLRWARENGCPWDASVCVNAAGRGDLEMLQWARERGCPWNTDVYESAASGGYLHILEWAYTEGLSLETCEDLPSFAICSYSFEVVVWTIEHIEWIPHHNTNLLAIVIRSSHSELRRLAEWLYVRGHTSSNLFRRMKPYIRELQEEMLRHRHLSALRQCTRLRPEDFDDPTLLSRLRCLEMEICRVFEFVCVALPNVDLINAMI